jgi:aldehyde dehydrogenase (NAD+)
MAPVDVPLSGHAAPGASATIIHEPLGRVLIFGPWNFPFGLLFQPLAGALAAGNTAILKPSELVPATSAICAKIVRSTFDESEVALFEGGPEVAEALLEHPFDHVFFTGSTNVGRKVMAAAARHLASVTLELGGKCPAIVDDGYDVQRAAERIAWGKFLNAGQVCLAPDHAWVPASDRDAFVAAVKTYIDDAYHAEGGFNGADMARILNERHIARLEGLIGDAVSRGATVVTGGKASDGRMPPTILIDVTPDSAIMGEEIFGPILPVLTYDEKDEVIARTSSGGVTVNDVLQHATEPNLPMGGVGASGLGAYHGVHSFRALSHARSVYRQAAVNPAAAFLRPPYGDRLPM